MGRYTEYFQDIWKLQANRKVLGVSLFGAIIDNTKSFTPGDPIGPAEGAAEAIQLLTQKGYDLLIISGQPSNKTRALSQNDFENILTGTKDFVAQVGGRIRNVYYAPGVDKNDPYVLPNIGMFERAQNENNFSWANSYFVGADVNEVKAAIKSKAKPVLIKNQNKDLKIKALELTQHVKVQEHSSLLEFAQSLE